MRFQIAAFHVFFATFLKPASAAAKGMAAVGAVCSIANRVDVLSKTLENLKFNWEETGGNDRRSRFAKCSRDFEENHLGNDFKTQRT